MGLCEQSFLYFFLFFLSSLSFFISLRNKQVCLDSVVLAASVQREQFGVCAIRYTSSTEVAGLAVGCFDVENEPNPPGIPAA